jgi:hypothetical protein
MNTGHRRKFTREFMRHNGAKVLIGILALSTVSSFAAPAAHAQVGSIACATSLFGLGSSGSGAGGIGGGGSGTSGTGSSGAGGISGGGGMGGGGSAVPVSAAKTDSILTQVQNYLKTIANNTTASKNVTCTWNGIAWSLAKTVLHALTGSVVNWINSGFQGSPAFLTNPEGYFMNLGDQITGAFIDNDSVLKKLVCSPFSVDIRLALALGQTNDKTVPYTCTLSSIINKVKNLPNSITVNGQSIGGFMGGDFSQGGWPAFIAIGEPNNNETGLYLQAHSDLLEQIGAKQGQVQQQLLQGNGFLSWQSCTAVSANNLTTATNPEAHPNYFGATSDGSGGSVTASVAANGSTQYQDCKTETPGSIINSSLVKSLGSSVDELNLTSDINEIVNALFSQLLIKTLSGGLFSASRSQSSSGSNLQSITDQLENDQQSQENQANSSVLQGQVANQIQPAADAAQQAATYREQIVSDLTAEQSLYQTLGPCDANDTDAEAIASTTDTLTQQITAAQTDADTASNDAGVYQDMISQIQNASSLSDTNDLSNQFSSQLSSTQYDTASDPAAAQTDLNSVTAEINAMETARGQYQMECVSQ